MGLSLGFFLSGWVLLSRLGCRDTEVFKELNRDLCSHGEQQVLIFSASPRETSK